MSRFDDLLLRAKLIQPHEHLIRTLPQDGKQQVIKSISRLEDIQTWADPMAVTKELSHVEKVEMQAQAWVKSQSLVNTAFVSGYEPAGSTIRKLYPNPFAPYPFVGENYWAAWKARRETRIEIARDGYVLTAPEGLSKKRIKAINDILADIKAPEFIVNICDHLNTVGNCWILRDNNVFGGLQDLNILLPEKIIPVLDDYGERVIAWDYEYGSKRVRFKRDALDHIRTYSLRSMDIGTPSLQGLIVDIETCMYASQFGHTMFKKGGLLKAIVAMENMEDPSLINDGFFQELVGRVQEIYERTHAGVRGSGGLMFLPNVRGVHNLINPKDLEGAYSESQDKIAVRVCESLGCPPERLGLSRSSQYQNNALIDDSVALSFDNNNYYLVGLAHQYFNEVILRDYLGIEDVTIQPSGEFGSISKAASEFGMNIAKMGCDVMTVDEFRVRVLHWEPLGGTEGAEYIGNVTNEAALQKSVGPAAKAIKDLRSGGKSLIRHRPAEIRHY